MDVDEVFKEIPSPHVKSIIKSDTLLFTDTTDLIMPFRPLKVVRHLQLLPHLN